jgi:hypothetical protein
MMGSLPRALLRVGPDARRRDRDETRPVNEDLALRAIAATLMLTGAALG